MGPPGPKNAQCPSIKFDAYSLIFLEVRAQKYSLFSFSKNVIEHCHEDFSITEVLRCDVLSL